MSQTPQKTPRQAQEMTKVSQLIFASRWLQLPLYVGLIAAQAVYVFHFGIELFHLVGAAFGNQSDIDALVKSIGYVSEDQEQPDWMTVRRFAPSTNSMMK